jgi:CDP-diacylglycerol---glycerol-3-phosphate 3-phosphatidyltransferase
MVLPNQLTILRIILTPFFIFFFLSEEPLMKQISIGIFLIAALTDWYDGWLARKFNYITDWGKFMDPLADKILTSTAFIGFVIIGVLNIWMVIIIILRDIIVTLLRASADYKKISFKTSLSAKWKTFIQMVFLYYLLIIYSLNTLKSLKEHYGNFINYLLFGEINFFLMLSITLFTVYTGITYIYGNRKIIGKILGKRS